MVFLVGEFAVLDSMFSLLLTATLMMFFAAYSADESPARFRLLVVTGILAGLAFMMKGFLALIIPAVVAVPFLLWEHRRRIVISMPWIPLLAALIVVMPWGIAIHLREPDFWHYFIFEEHLHRFVSGHAQHSESFWFFIPILLGGALPWTALMPAAIIGLNRKTFSQPIVRFAVCWFTQGFCWQQ